MFCDVAKMVEFEGIFYVCLLCVLPTMCTDHEKEYSIEAVWKTVNLQWFMMPDLNI